MGLVHTGPHMQLPSCCSLSHEAAPE